MVTGVNRARKEGGNNRTGDEEVGGGVGLRGRRGRARRREGRDGEHARVRRREVGDGEHASEPGPCRHRRHSCRRRRMGGKACVLEGLVVDFSSSLSVYLGFKKARSWTGPGETVRASQFLKISPSKVSSNLNSSNLRSYRKT